MKEGAIMQEREFSSESEMEFGMQDRGMREYSPGTTLGATLSQISILFFCIVLAMATVSHNANAAIWQPQQEISTDVGAEWQFCPAIAADGDRVHVAWMDGGDGDYDIYYRSSNGTSWELEQEISTDLWGEDQRCPSIAAEGGKVYIVWEDLVDGDQDIYYRYFDGSSWWSEQEISTDVTNENQQVPSIAVDGSEVHVVWQDRGGGDLDIHYRYFNGTSWQPEQEISSDVTSESQEAPSIAAENGKVYVVWHDWGDGDPDIYFRYFNGISWQPEQEISTDVGAEEQKYASIDVEGSKVYVIWEDWKDADGDIYYRHFDGALWQPEQEISTDVGTENQLFPSVVVSASKVHAVWQDRGDGDSDIYHRYFDGTVWRPKQEVSTDSGAEWQDDPSIATNGTTVHIVWVDEGDGDLDIYYRKGAEDIAPPESNAKMISPYWQSEPTFGVNWTATDNYDLANVSLYYRHSSDNSSWSDWKECSRNSNISGTSASGTFPFTAPNGDGFYEFYTIATDTSDNRELAPISADTIAGLATTPSPPRILEAFLSGVNSENVTILWDPSPDDGAGKNNVIRYDVYRGSAYDSTGSSYILHVSVPAGTSHYVDGQAGNGDPSSLFYEICAVSLNNNTGCAETQAAKSVRPLLEGPNLLSVPLIQSHDRIETVLQTVKWDKAWSYNSSIQKWKWHMKFKPYIGDLERIALTDGFWINVTEVSNLTVAGIVPSTTAISLHEGWNLVGFPSFREDYTIADLKADVTTDRIEGFNASAPPYSLRLMLGGDILRTGYGYWMSVTAETTWIVRNE